MDLEIKEDKKALRTNNDTMSIFRGPLSTHHTNSQILATNNFSRKSIQTKLIKKNYMSYRTIKFSEADSIDLDREHSKQDESQPKKGSNAGKKSIKIVNFEGFNNLGIG